MPPTLDELDAEIARQREHMDLHLSGMIIARKVIGELQAIRPYLEGAPAQSGAERPADAAPPDYPETTMRGCIQRSVCADPCQSKVLAKRLGISRSHASGALSRLRQEGLVALRDHVYGPPEGWEARETCDRPDPAPAVSIVRRIHKAVCAAPSSPLDVAARLGIGVDRASNILLILLKRRLVGFCGGLYGPPDDLTKTPAPPLTRQERIWLSACAAPDTAKVIAKRLGIPDQIAASNLSQLCRAGKLSYRNGIYGPPDKAGTAA